jgi:cyanophycinase
LRDPDSIQGSLFAIGGREDRTRDKEVLRRFVALCGGADARLLVISTASRNPAPKVAEYEAAFRECGARKLVFAHPIDRRSARDSKLLEALDSATGVFFVGGNQLKLVTEIGGSELVRRLHVRHSAGLAVGGTSAGASALGAVMIARGKARSAARLSSLRMTPGFGLRSNLILDQHFRERDRFGRLLAAVLCNPTSLGLGLDEDTALLLEGDSRLSVMGKGSVTIVDGSKLEANDIGIVPEESPAAFVGMRLHVLTNGWSYDLAEGRVTRPVPVESGQE